MCPPQWGPKPGRRKKKILGPPSIAGIARTPPSGEVGKISVSPWRGTWAKKRWDDERGEPSADRGSRSVASSAHAAALMLLLRNPIPNRTLGRSGQKHARPRKTCALSGRGDTANFGMYLMGVALGSSAELGPAAYEDESRHSGGGCVCLSGCALCAFRCCIILVETKRNGPLLSLARFSVRGAGHDKRPRRRG